MKCWCDNCLFGNSTRLSLLHCQTPKTKDELHAEVIAEWGEDCFDEPVYKCPGFRTSTVVQECGEEIDDDESICSTCQIMRERQEDREDEAVERLLQRQLEEEEYFSMKKYGDLDGDNDNDTITNEEVLALQRAEDKKKR